MDVTKLWTTEGLPVLSDSECLVYRGEEESHQMAVFSVLNV